MTTKDNVYELAIADIVINDDLQVRRKLDGSAIARYATVYKASGEMPPIRVARIKDSGTLLLVDGWHRIEALRDLGKARAEAEVVDATLQEAHWLAASANLKHGVPLKSGEIRNVFRAYIRARKHYNERGRLKSYRTMAAELGGTRNFTTIRAWMLKDFPRIAERLGGGDEAGGGEGGPPEVEPRHPEAELLEAGLRGAENAAAAARGITDPMQRSLLVEKLECALKVAKEAGPWIPTDDDF